MIVSQDRWDKMCGDVSRLQDRVKMLERSADCRTRSADAPHSPAAERLRATVARLDELNHVRCYKCKTVMTPENTAYSIAHNIAGPICSDCAPKTVGSDPQPDCTLVCPEHPRFRTGIILWHGKEQIEFCTVPSLSVWLPLDSLDPAMLEAACAIAYLYFRQAADEAGWQSSSQARKDSNEATERALAWWWRGKNGGTK